MIVEYKVQALADYERDRRRRRVVRSLIVAALVCCPSPIRIAWEHTHHDTGRDWVGTLRSVPTSPQAAGKTY